MITKMNPKHNTFCLSAEDVKSYNVHLQSEEQIFIGSIAMVYHTARRKNLLRKI